MGETQVGRGFAKSGSASGETGGGRRGQRARGSSTLGERAGCYVAEAMAESGRLHHDSAGAIKNKPDAERADAQEQLGPPFVYVWVAFLRSLASTKELGAEHVAVLKQYWENSVLKSAPVQLVSHFRYCRAMPCRKVEGKEGWTRIVFCLDPITLPFEEALESALRLQKGVRKYGPAPRGPLEAPDADAREIERLARRVEQHSQRMAELLRRGVLEPSLAYAFLMTKGGQRIPQAKSKAKARASSSRATTSEGAEAAPDTSPPRLPPERPPMVFTRCETMEPSNAGPEVRTSRRA